MQYFRTPIGFLCIIKPKQRNYEVFQELSMRVKGHQETTTRCTGRHHDTDK